MLRPRPLAAVLLFTLWTAAPAAAQGWPERIWITGDGGVQTAGASVVDTIEVQQFVETGTVKTSYPGKPSPVVDGSVGVRLWKGLGLGVAVSRASARSSASVEGRIPHPFFDNQFRAVAGSTSVARSELGTHLQIAYLMPVSHRLRLILSAGPSWLSVEQTLVTDVQYAQEYPYDTATFTGATTRRPSASAIGFNVAGDVFWMLSRHLGAGGVLRFSRATVHASAAAGQSVSIEAGGAQGGAGVRLVF